MVLKLFFVSLFFFGCTNFKRDNPADPGGGNYVAPPSSIPAEVSYGALTYQGQTYKTVKIGNQTWIAENLNYDVSGSVCYNNSESNCTTYGRLYNWATAMALDPSCNSRTCSGQVQSKHRGICPQGWHIPSDAEWTALTNFVGSNAGTKLKSKSGWSSGNGTDDFGFSALPGGIGGSDGSFYYVGYEGFWWSASERDATGADYRYMSYILNNVESNQPGSHKSNLLSVRCIKD